MVDKGLLVDMADYAERERRARLSADVIHHAKRAVIDCFAALLAGGNDPPATLLARAFGDSIGHGKALLYPSGRKAPLRLAALINATAAHTAEFDDIFRDAIYHPGAPTIPAALAAAQSRGADGMAFLRAVVVGYEISTRIGLALGRPHYRYWHTTATVGTFGSAAAVATLLGLDRMQFAHALATAATMAAGLQQAFRSEAMSKPLMPATPPRQVRSRPSRQARASPARSTCSMARPGSAPRWPGVRTGRVRSSAWDATTTSRR